MGGAVRQHLAFGLVMAVVAVAGVRIAQYHWREGAAVLGGSMVLAAGLRAVLPSSQAGLLAIRGRVWDVLIYAGLGMMVIVTAVTID